MKETFETSKVSVQVLRPAQIYGCATFVSIVLLFTFYLTVTALMLHGLDPIPVNVSTAEPFVLQLPRATQWIRAVRLDFPGCIVGPLDSQPLSSDWGTALDDCLDRPESWDLNAPDYLAYHDRMLPPGSSATIQFEWKDPTRNGTFLGFRGRRNFEAWLQDKNNHSHAEIWASSKQRRGQATLRFETPDRVLFVFWANETVHPNTTNASFPWPPARVVDVQITWSYKRPGFCPMLGPGVTVDLESSIDTPWIIVLLPTHNVSSLSQPPQCTFHAGQVELLKRWATIAPVYFVVTALVVSILVFIWRQARHRVQRSDPQQTRLAAFALPDTENMRGVRSSTATYDALPVQE